MPASRVPTTCDRLRRDRRPRGGRRPRPVGGDSFTQSLSILKPLGTLIAIGFAGGLWQNPSVQWLVGRNARCVGPLSRPADEARPGVRARVRRRSCSRSGRGGEIDPLVGATFPLADADDAHALIESRRHVGKVVLEP